MQKIYPLICILTLISTQADAATYTYDKLHRLKSVVYESGTEIYYEYDPAGNLLSVSTAEEYRISAVINDVAR